jgi:hypothetical protein
MNRQWEKILSSAHFSRRDNRAQHTGVSHGDHNGTARLSCNTTRFQSDLVVTVLECFFNYIH